MLEFLLRWYTLRKKLSLTMRIFHRHMILGLTSYPKLIWKRFWIIVVLVLRLHHWLLRCKVRNLKLPLFSMPANKAPWPSDFPMEFNKAVWTVVGKDLITAVQSFFLSGFLPRSINATMLSLAPKTTSDVGWVTSDQLCDAIWSTK